MVEYGKHRPPHIYEAGAIYFLSGTTLHHEHLFDTCEKKGLLKNCLQRATKKYLAGLSAWVIVDWHYHLLVKVRAKRDLTRFIKSFHGSSAIEINKHDGAPGRQVWYQYWDRFPRTEGITGRFSTTFISIQQNTAW